MTVQSEFTSWQEQPKQPDPRTCAPICLTWMNYLLDRWGGQNLGCYNARPVVGGSALSSHGSGAACDWRYASPGPGRNVMLNEVLPLFIGQSRELGVQAIHDYVGCRIWRPPACSGRPDSPSPECGWKQQNPGPQLGQTWATWIHLECLPSRWSDTHSVEQMLGSGPIVEPPPVQIEGDEMPMFIAKHPTATRWAIGDGLHRREFTVPDDVDAIISDRDGAGAALFDLGSGAAVDQRSDISEVGGWDKRLGKLV